MNTNNAMPGSRYKDALKLTTGIKNTLIINPAQPSQLGWSPLIMAHGDFFGADPNPSSKATAYDKILKEIVYYDYFDAIVDKSNGADYVNTTQFSLTNFIKWINAITNALQLYYNVEHILAFNSTYTNENIGLTYVQNSYFNSTIRRKHKDLRDVLTRFAIPARIEAVINYMYQNFSMSLDPQAPIIRLNYNGVLHPYATTTPGNEIFFDLGSTLYDSMINELNDPDVRMVNSMISQTTKFGSDTGRTLSPVSRSAVTDLGFSTFWHNMPIVTFNGVYPNVATDTAEVYYATFDQNLDGLIYAMSGIANTSDPTIIKPGLYKPLNKYSTPTDKRQIGNMTYLNAVGTIGSLLQNSTFINISGSYWAPLVTGTTDTPVSTPRYAASLQSQVVQTNNIANTEAVTQRSVRWLFNLIESW